MKFSIVKYLFEFIHENSAHAMLAMLESSTNEGHFCNLFPQNPDKGTKENKSG